MMCRLVCLITAAAIAFPLLAQTNIPQCASPRELRQRVSQELLRDDRLRSIVGARPLVLRVTCEEREKDAPRTVAIAYVVGYETGAAAEVTLDATDFRTIDVRKLSGAPQSSEEEREEARAIVREKRNVAANLAIEGGFVVDPPPGAPPGRYLVFLISAPKRGASIEEVVVDLTRRTVTPRRRIEAAP